MLGTTTKLSMVFQILLGLGLTVTEINTKKYRNKKINNVKDVEIACQKVCKQGRDD